MGIERQHESDKIHGDKLESALDKAAAGGPGRKQGQSEPDDEAEELDLEDDNAEVEDSEDE
jgi:hypothetical protein